MNKKIKGDIFIIPNGSCPVKDFLPYSRERARNNIKFFTGIDVADEERLIEVWATSPSCDNWSCHQGFQKEAGIEDDRGFATYLPVSLFEGKKEGDTVVLSCEAYDADIELTLAQLKYRYCEFGTFEEVLSKQ